MRKHDSRLGIQFGLTRSLLSTQAQTILEISRPSDISLYFVSQFHHFTNLLGNLITSPAVTSVELSFTIQSARKPYCPNAGNNDNSVHVLLP